MGFRIVDQTSKGNAMSAYGTARGFRWNVPLLALVAGSLVLVAVLVVFFLRMTVPLPEHTLFFVAARPAVLNKAITPSLQRDLPAPWREVIGTNSHFPALFGVALDNNRQPHSFAIIPRTTFVGNPPGLSKHPYGLYHLLSVDPLPIQETSLQALDLVLRQTFENEATFLLRGDLLFAWAFDISFEENPDMLVRGVWKNGVGHLELRDLGGTEHVDIDASLFSIVHRPNDSRGPMTAGLLSQGVDLREVSTLPTVTSLTISPLGNRALTLQWLAALPEEDRARLPDAATTSDNTRLTFLETVTTTQETIPPHSVSDCPGVPHFVLEDAPLARTLEALGLAPSWQNLLNTVRIHQTDSDVLICIK